VQNLDGIVVDANLSSILVNGVAVPAAAKVALSATSTYFSVPVTLVRGSNKVTVQATDLAGNTSALITRTVTLNPDLPAFTVALPADNSYMATGGTAPASGTAASYTSVTASNGCAGTATPAGGNWSIAGMTVSTGFDSCWFAATDGVNTVSEKQTVNASGGFAQLAITSPASDIATKNSSVVISGSVAVGALTPTISVDGVTAVNVSTYNAGTGAFSHTVTLSSQGPHYVKVTSNGTTAIRNLIYDTVPPAISIQANAHATPSTIIGSIEPSSRITAINAKLNGTPYSIPVSAVTYAVVAGQVIWTADLSTYGYDEASLTFTAADPASNTASVTYAKGVPTGDCNGDGVVDLLDAICCLRQIAGTSPSDPTKHFQCDVGALVGGHTAQDGVVDITDEVLILNKAAGAITF
jgi:hypothetical protein